MKAKLLRHTVMITSILFSLVACFRYSSLESRRKIWDKLMFQSRGQFYRVKAFREGKQPDLGRLYVGMNMGQVLDWVYELQRVCPEAEFSKYLNSFYQHTGTNSTIGLLGTHLIISVFGFGRESEREKRKCLRGFPTEDTPQFNTIHLSLPDGFLSFAGIVFREADNKGISYLDRLLSGLQSEYSGSFHLNEHKKENVEEISICITVAPDTLFEISMSKPTSPYGTLAMSFEVYDCSQEPLNFESK